MLTKMLTTVLKTYFQINDRKLDFIVKSPAYTFQRDIQSLGK